MIDIICQSAIFILGSLTIFLLAQKNKWQRWGHVVGLIQEMFWFVAIFRSRQWGIFALCFIYTGCFILGIYNHWIKKEKENE